ncbi:MAG: helix-turn-helix domain-containing protein, partial [Thermomicrobiales bacterium]
MKAARTSAGQTQKQLAAADVSVQYVANVENQHSTLSKPETIRAMAAALNIDADELLAAASKIPDDIKEWLEGDLKATKQTREGMNTKRK